MDVRNINKGESSRVLRLVEQCGPYVAPHNLYVYWMLENYYTSTCKVMEHDSELIGFISGMPSVDNKSLFIWQICVHKEYRNQGIAFLLLDSILQSAREIGYRFMELSISENNNASQSFFEKYARTNQLKTVEKRKEHIGSTIEVIIKYEL
ncbi:GNAT family N-acetyltransferase [Gorillibacterium massiliense]|uniref:GNAT family N-acetyltransferase n=1 Tax=Gorillibacterium massiliense TaxID=1280390 RepID=UPI0005946B0A|nr:GNAT family N-acetyltransferase [Gorillibacterium massiliense]